MFFSKHSIFLIGFGSLFATGCADLQTRQGSGSFIGAASGAIIGSQVGGGSAQLVTGTIGAILGSMVGGEIGRGLDELDQAKAQNAFQKSSAAKLGTPIYWKNPHSGHSGAVEAIREGYSSDGGYCREFRHTVIIEGRSQEAYGTACRQPGGQWQIITSG